MDEIDGITLDKLTEYSSRYTAFQAQYDELGAKAAFELSLIHISEPTRPY